MLRVKIFGAGSIGNHLAHASRSLGWEVTVCDVSEAALKRMQDEIYPSRYGKWDSSIKLFTNDKAPAGNFDLILIGTPPEHHLPLAIKALAESPRGLMIEKPLCGPRLEHLSSFLEAARKAPTKIFVGYTHVVAKSMQLAESIIKSGKLGEIQTLDVEFREHWEGIFKAHSWLKGPQDSYLGYWVKGGGASGEHSHAINLWQHLAHVLGFGPVKEVSASLSYIRDGKAEYDNLCLLNLETEKGLLGRVVQDVITRPSKKWARIQGSKAALEWIANYNSDGDAVILFEPGQKEQATIIPKKRPDDFIEELRHFERFLSQKEPSPLDLKRGLDTMAIIAAAHESEERKAVVPIDLSNNSAIESLRGMVLEK